MLLAAFGASVQAQDFTKKELAKAAKMAKNKKWRKPLPYFMKDDFKCESTIYQLSKIDSKDIAAMRDSAQQRMEENEFLEKAVPLAVKNKTDVVKALLDSINRERLRFEEMEKESGPGQKRPNQQEESERPVERPLKENPPNKMTQEKLGINRASQITL